ncbi:MAG: TetR/AcrR family transcriptional regulator [Pseudomonadota bacterium]
MSKAAAGIDGRSKKRPGVEEQREIITRSAVELFAGEGAKAVSIGRICDHAGVSRPTFYRCFTDKAALLKHIYEAAVDVHTQPILFGTNLSDPKQLRQRIDAMLDAIFERARLAQLVFVESNDPASPAFDIVDQTFEKDARILARDLRKRGAAPVSLVYLKSVMAAVQWIVHDAIRKGLTPTVRREAGEATYELVRRALMP